MPITRGVIRRGLQRLLRSAKLDGVLPISTSQAPALGDAQRAPRAPSPVSAVPTAKVAPFKTPDRWVASGSSLQPFADGRSLLTVRLGIDFGTAFTKVAIGVSGKVFLVDWDGLHADSPRYLLGGELSETPGGALCGRAPGVDRVLTDFKLPFVGGAHNSTAEDLATAATFLAWVMKYSRAWLYRHHSTVLRRHRLAWEVNLGAPTGSWAAGGDALRDRYRRLGLIAWRASQEQEVSLARSRDLVPDTAVAESGWGLDFLGVLPEFAAQVAAYVRSPQRQDGLHVLVDAGAGTLDVACFRIMRAPGTGDNTFPVFASAVTPLGTHFLMRERGALVSAGRVRWSSMDPVPTAASFAVDAGIAPAAVHETDQRFVERVAGAINPVLDRTRMHMDRRAPEFARGGEMPVFLVGGGAHVDVYSAGVSLAFNARSFRHRLRRFPVDGGLEARFGIDDEATNRLCVAQGLTYDAEMIGRLIPPSRIPPDSPPGTRSRPDRDDLYPK